MQLTLPSFEGIAPDSATVSLTGNMTSLVPALALDEEVILIVRGTVKKIGHDRKGQGSEELLVRNQTVAVDRGYVIIEAEKALDWFDEAQSALEREKGVTRLDFSASDGDEGEADAQEG